MSLEVFWMMIYLGIGCLVASVILWKNWFSFKEEASVIFITFDALGIVASWGMFLGLFVILAPFAWLIERWPMKNIDDWTKSQYDKS